MLMENILFVFGFLLIIMALLLPLHIYFLYIKKGGLIIYSDKFSRKVMNLSMIVFVVFGFMVVLLPQIIEYKKVVSGISLGTLFVLSLCTIIASILNACIFLILKKIPPNYKDGLIGGVIGAIAFFLLVTLYYFSLYDEVLFKTFTNFILRSYLLILIPLLAGVVQGIIGGYYIGGRVKSIIGSLLMGFVVYAMMRYIFFAFGGH